MLIWTVLEKQTGKYGRFERDWQLLPLSAWEQLSLADKRWWIFFFLSPVHHFHIQEHDSTQSAEPWQEATSQEACSFSKVTESQKYLHLRSMSEVSASRQ